MSKNVAVFVDVANIFYAAKAAGVDIDYVTLLKSASAGRDLVRAYAYTGLDPENENQRNFHSFLARHGYRVVSKDIRKYGDGKVKANLDIELVVDMMKTARNLDIAIVVSGDGDFAPAIRAVQEMGVRVEVISFRGNTSSDLIDVADSFTDITALAKVEKGSSRSGRRVAEAADEDLSMTEVPDKQTEGAGDRRRGGRGRGGRGRGREEEPVTRSRRPIGEPAAVTSSGAPLVVLPGEKLSRAAGGPGGVDLEETDDLIDPETGGAVAAFGGALGGLESRAPVEVDDAELANGASSGDGDAEAEGEDAEGRRRRRRRGGRGRGRGRGREGEAQERALPIGAAAGEDPAGDDEGYEEPPVEAPRSPRTTPFGSVWDSQLGVPSMPSTASSAPLGDDEDFEEPEIPEYLIAERRNRGRQGPQGGRGGRGGPRGGRSAYAAAMERERYGRGGGGGGINRYPDVSARERPVEPRRDDRRDERPARPLGGGGAGAGGGTPRRSGGDEPWSEVPPELEAMLRAQLGSRPAERRPEPRPAAPQATSQSIAGAPVASDPLGAPEDEEQTVADRAAVVPDGAYETPDLPSPAPVEEPAAAVAEAAPRRRATRRTRATADAAVTPDGTATADAAATPLAEASATDADTAAEPKRRTTRRRTAAAADEAVGPTDAAAAGEAEAAEAPKRRATRRRTTAAADAPASAEGNAPADDATGGEAAPAPRRRTTRRTAAEETPAE